MTLFKIYWIFCKIGLFTFGGGYAMIPLFQEELVRHYRLISVAEFGNILAIAQMTPGPVGINAATYIGYQYGGFSGALLGTLGLLTPSLIIVFIVIHFVKAFENSRAVKGVLGGIRPAALGMIAAAVVFLAEMSVFTSPIPWDALFSWFSRDSASAAAGFGISWQGVLIFVFALIVAGRLKLNVIWTMLFCAVLGILLY